MYDDLQQYVIFCFIMSQSFPIDNEAPPKPSSMPHNAFFNASLFNSLSFLYKMSKQIKPFQVEEFDQRISSQGTKVVSLSTFENDMKNASPVSPVEKKIDSLLIDVQKKTETQIFVDFLREGPVVQQPISPKKAFFNWGKKNDSSPELSLSPKV